MTAAFERLYQGGGGPGDGPGLKAREAPLVSLEALQRLKRALPGGLAIVTGRPRRGERWRRGQRGGNEATAPPPPLADAFEAIERYGWSGVFDAVVCMEDAPLKPDPAPVRLALERLRSAHALRNGGGAAAAGEAAALITPARTAMVGDTVDDIRAAVGAGVTGEACGRAA